MHLRSEICVAIIRNVVIVTIKRREFGLKKQRIAWNTFGPQLRKRLTCERFGIMLRLIRRIDGFEAGAHRGHDESSCGVLLPCGSVNERGVGYQSCISCVHPIVEWSEHAMSKVQIR